MNVLSCDISQLAVNISSGFPTRITNTSCTLIDNIYINAHKHSFTVLPLVNGLSDHDAQILTLSKFLIPVSRPVHSTTRKIDSTSMNQFTLLLSYENWEDVFLDASVDLIFNNYLNTYLCLFMLVFPLKNHRISINVLSCDIFQLAVNISSG